MLKKLLALVILLFAFLYPVTFNLFPTFAADQPEFATSYDVHFDLSEDGYTSVTEKISLRNLTSQHYATQFNLTIGATQITDVTASDPSGPLEVSTTPNGTATTLSVKFNQQVAGLGKTLNWTLNYKTKDFSQKIGKIWEVGASKISSSGSLEAYNLTVSVPNSFGAPTQISPKPVNQFQSNGKLNLQFNKDQLTSSGMSASFGETQIFDFNLEYHLQNRNLRPVLTSIALPPDTAYQDLVFQRIDPEPLNVSLDDDGNFLAWYHLNRNQNLDITVLGSAKLYAKSKVKNPVLDPDLRKKYTLPQTYWDSENPTILAKLKEILAGNETKSNTEKARIINRFVAGYLKYDESRISKDHLERLGSLSALTSPDSALCIEFSDLFVAMARAAGIPARLLDGFAYTENNTLRPLSLNRDILHAWPEYWDDSRGWVMIDPTWENTTGGVDYFNKLDLNHFVFAVHGLSSTEPASAGSYKYLGTDSKDVNVNLGTQDFLGKPTLVITSQVPKPMLAGFPSKVKVKIANVGNSLQQSLPLLITTGQVNLLPPLPTSTGPIPAFGYGEFEINARTKSFVDSYIDNLSVSVGDQKFNQSIEVKPFFIFQGFPYVLGAILGGFSLIYFMLLGTLIYRRRIAKRRK